ncbi:MAG: nuclear transport factor 2 family protein [Hyphomicrobiales bacterium]|nr:nuclear transport factor 2 family protein [Hyphomicrobiales bacterium]
MFRTAAVAFACLTVAASLMVSAAKAEDETVAAVRAAAEALDRAFEDQDPDAILSLVTEDHVAVTPYYRAPYTNEQSLSTLSELDFTITASDPVAITVLDPNSAIVVQTKTYDGTYREAPIPSHVYATGLWVKRDGNWLEKHYQETAIDGL